METWLRNNEHTIKTLGILSAAVFTLFQYFGHINESRIQQTLILYKEFSSEPLLSARNSLLKEVEAWWPEIEKIPKPATPESEMAQKKKWTEFVVGRVNSNTELVAQANTMLEFFDALQICTENDICDEASAQELLSVSAKELMENFCPYIAYMRYVRNNDTFANKANVFAGNACHVEIYKQFLLPK